MQLRGDFRTRQTGVNGFAEGGVTETYAIPPVEGTHHVMGP